MRFELYREEQLVNSIAADLSFVKAYCKAEGLTYRQLPESQALPVPAPQPDPVLTLQEENKLLKAQIKAQADRQEFLEDCIAEMAVELYV